MVWFALNDDRPLVAFAGIWTTFNDNRGTKSKPVPEPNAGIMLAENGATVPQIMAALGRKTPKMALYYCRLPNQKLLADPAADVLDLAFAGREEGRQADCPAAGRPETWSDPVNIGRPNRPLDLGYVLEIAALRSIR